MVNLFVGPIGTFDPERVSHRPSNHNAARFANRSEMQRCEWQSVTHARGRNDRDARALRRDRSLSRVL